MLPYFLRGGDYYEAYEKQVAYSTVTIYVSEVKYSIPTAPGTVGTPIQKGLSKNLTQISNAGSDLFVWVISNSPILLILVVVLIFLILILKKIWKKQRIPFYRHSDLESEGSKLEDTSKKEDNKI